MQSDLPSRSVNPRPLYTANILGTAIALFTLVGPLWIVNLYAPNTQKTAPTAIERVVRTNVSAKQPQKQPH
jgi:hypothetical protein